MIEFGTRRRMTYAPTKLYRGKTFSLAASAKIEAALPTGETRYENLPLYEDDSGATNWIQRETVKIAGLTHVEFFIENPNMPGPWFWNVHNGGWSPVGFEGNPRFVVFSKTAAYVLRHAPGLHGEDGSTPIQVFMREMLPKLRRKIDGNGRDIKCPSMFASFAIELADFVTSSVAYSTAATRAGTRCGPPSPMRSRTSTLFRVMAKSL